MKLLKTSQITILLESLQSLYPEAHCALTYANAHELLIATILSAQCTDERVNQVTPALFKRYPTLRGYAEANLTELESFIRPTGFFRSKARSIQNSCRIILEKFDGKVPQSLEELTQLAGVGRKTANVVLGNIFGIPGLTVDTHMKRLCFRLGLSKNNDPVKIEFDLMKLIPQSQWTIFSHQIISHGRKVCKARKPLCAECKIDFICLKNGV